MVRVLPMRFVLHLIALAWLAGLGSGCELPTAPVRDNPADPGAPNYRPLAPSRLDVEVVGYRQVAVSWHDESDFADSVVVTRSLGGAPFEVVGYGASRRPFVDTVGISGTYTYAVAAKRGAAESPFVTSGPIEVLFLPAPWRLDAETIGAGVIRLEWPHVSPYFRKGSANYPISFIVHRHIEGQAPMLVANVSAGETSVVDTVRAPGLYTYEVAATYAGDVGEGTSVTHEVYVLMRVPEPSSSSVIGSPVALPDGSAMLFAHLQDFYYRYDPASRSLSKAPFWPSGGPGQIYEAISLTGGRVLVLGDRNLMYDAGADSWISLGEPGHARVGSGVRALQLRDGRVLIVGKNRADARYAFATLFDPQTLAFHEVAPPVHALSNPYLIEVPDGRVLVIGDDAAEWFDPVTATWTVAPSPPQFRQLAQAYGVEDGSVLMVAGVAKGDAIAEIDRFDWGTKRWVLQTTAPVGLCWSVQLTMDTILGYECEGAFYHYDLKTDSWTRNDGLVPAYLLGAAADRLRNGHVLIRSNYGVFLYINE